MEQKVIQEGVAECIRDGFNCFNKGVRYRFQKMADNKGKYYRVFIRCTGDTNMHFDSRLFKRFFKETEIVPGNPKQEQTAGKMFILTGEFRRPKIGEFYYGEIDRCATLSEDSGPDFPEGAKRLILREVDHVRDCIKD